MRLLRSGAAVLCGLAAFATAGCGLSASPADGLRFQAPPGWRPSPGVLGFMQFWRPPSGAREVLMIFKSPKKLSANDVYSSANMQGAFKNVTVLRKQTLQICGNQRALFVQGRATSRNDTESNVDIVITDVLGTSYMAMYLRPIDAAANPQAEAALHELCPKS